MGECKAGKKHREFFLNISEIFQDNTFHEILHHYLPVHSFQLPNSRSILYSRLLHNIYLLFQYKN